MADTTLLLIHGVDIPPYSARGITQTYAPIDAIKNNMRRTVNGVLVNTAPDVFRKYKSTISCTDMDVPALSGIFPGDVLTIDCITELSYLTIGGAPERSVVAGSSRVDGLFTFFRPTMTFVVMDYSTSREEWAASLAWQLDLEEQ